MTTKLISHRKLYELGSAFRAEVSLDGSSPTQVRIFLDGKELTLTIAEARAFAKFITDMDAPLAGEVA